MDKNEQLIGFFYTNLNSLSRISIEEVRDVITLASIVMSDKNTSETLKVKSFILLSHIATQNFLTLEERWSLYWMLRSENIKMVDYDEYDTVLDKIYTSIYLDVKKEMPGSLLSENLEGAAKKPVVIVTSQFLTEEHASTKAILDLAYAIQRNMGIPAVIINSAAGNVKSFPYMAFEFSSDYIPEYAEQKKISYKEAEFLFYQTAETMLNLQETANIVYNIRKLSPRVVLGIGGGCLAADLCSDFTKTAVITDLSDDTPDAQSLKQLFSELNVAYADGITVVDESQFRDVFVSEPDKKTADIEGKLDQLMAMARIMDARLRDNEWAVVYNSTVQGSEWFHGISLSPGRAALGYPGQYALYRSLDEFRPKHILEMGLGQSTRVIGAYAEHFQAEHYIVEHDRSWIDFFLNKHGVKENTEIVCLERKEAVYRGRWIGTETPIKYYEGFAEAFQGKKFDFIFIDGPQGSKEYSRVDIMEILPECLADSFVIMIDDSERKGEWNTIKAIGYILTKANISCRICQYDGIKNTALIVSEDLQFLCTL